MDARLSARPGFSLLELLIVLGLGLGVVAGLLSLFRVHAEVARRQSQTAELQQSLRIARHELARFSRTAGRGGLPRGAALAVLNNLAAGSRIGRAGTPGVVPGTDVLVVRGVLGSSMVDAADGGGGDPDSQALPSRLTLRGRSETGAVRALEALAEAADQAGGEALLLSAGPGSPRCAVVQLTGVEGSRSEGGELVELVVELGSGGSDEDAGYRAVAEECQPLPASAVRRAGLLEEHRFYLRRDNRPAGAAARHQLSRIRFRPGSDRVHPSSPKSGVALVDHALDLQVALGFDLDGDGTIVEAAAGRGSDEWLYNDPGDAPEAESWSRGRLELVRWTLVLRSAHAARGHLPPRRERLEDRDYEATPEAGIVDGRIFLRASTTAVVNPRGR